MPSIESNISIAPLHCLVVRGVIFPCKILTHVVYPDKYFMPLCPCAMSKCPGHMSPFSPCFVMTLRHMSNLRNCCVAVFMRLSEHNSQNASNQSEMSVPKN